MTTSKSPRTESGRRFFAFCALGLGLAVTGCSHSGGGGATGGTPVAPPPPAPAPGVAQAPQAGGSVVVYRLAGSTAGDQSAADANGLVPATVTLSAGSKSPAKDALETLVSGDDSPLPPGTKLLGVKIDPDAKLATVDFSREFKSNFQGGETHEAQAINSVLETLGQFPNVTKVQFLVEGRKIDSLGGTVELNEPLPTPQSGAALASSSSAGGA